MELLYESESQADGFIVERTRCRNTSQCAKSAMRQWRAITAMSEL